MWIVVAFVVGALIGAAILLWAFIDAERNVGPRF